MPQQAWNDKRERQYEHIKEGMLDRGENEDEAEEIAARTVNKERARAGEWFGRGGVADVEAAMKPWRGVVAIEAHCQGLGGCTAAPESACAPVIPPTDITIENVATARAAGRPVVGGIGPGRRGRCTVPRRRRPSASRRRRS